jgi:hypothetical protein
VLSVRRNRNFKLPPTRWVDLIEIHDHKLARVRMMWRRGGGEYRPMVPTEALADQAEETGDWDSLELEETHFEWITEGDDAPTQRRERITETVGELWEIAIQWTRAFGDWCDFQLLGFDSANRTVFCDGKRCDLRTVDGITGSDEPDREPDRDDGADGWARRREFERRMDGRINDFLDRMSTERNKSFETARESLSTAQRAFGAVQESIDAAPRLLTKASEVLREAIDYQSEQNRQIRDQSSGRLEMRAKAFAEMERSRRRGMALEFGKFAVEAGMAHLVPLANRIVEVLGDRNVTVFPEFKRAQQAMAYLFLDITQFQLSQLFGTKSNAPGEFMALLDQGSRMPIERNAIEHIVELIPILRAEEFRRVATAEQQLAARYIIGRAAMLRMADYGEDESDA